MTTRNKRIFFRKEMHDKNKTFFRWFFSFLAEYISVFIT